ncbi:MAG TPA: hypothetical protein VHW45_17785 [Candidatus Sulfotelmatobacter sp.]|jgi:hypothetical protein|nr:hypothetical protein [Candidatus Sulfotelmatobacter sp.]
MGRRFIIFFAFALLVCGLTGSASAQEFLADAPVSSVEPAPAVFVPSRHEFGHRFWDKTNRSLFVAAAASNFGDFGVTRMNLQNGGRELNPVVRVFGHSTPALAMNFAGETAGAIGLSYFFHKSGHHRLERMVSIVDIGGSAGAVAFGLIHR